MNEERATGIAQRLSKELEAAVERTRQIEAEVRRYEDRAFRAEKWVHRVYKEVEEKFSITRRRIPDRLHNDSRTRLPYSRLSG